MSKQFPYHRFPSKAHHFSYFLWEQFNFNFLVTQNRKTKHGDFRFDSRKPLPYTITINHDLNVYSFFVTYLHEVAHLMVNKKYGMQVLPHGKEWKQVYSKLLMKALTLEVFPPKLAYVVHHHAQNPGASVVADPLLYEALKEYDPQSTGILLKYVKEDGTFVFNGEIFRKIELRRTRVRCLKVSNDKEYLISVLAEVQLID